MKTKKVILFIVEGITDKTSLGGIIDKIVKDENVRFHITEGDITSDRFTTAKNAITKVNDHVKRFLKSNFFKKSDLLQIVHIIDTDGAYVGEEFIEIEDIEEFRYSTESIKANSVEAVLRRNEKKSQVENRLATCPKIAGIPYSMYYFSCNLEHVLHDEINMDDSMKMQVAEEFADSFYGKEEEFIEFIKNNEFVVAGDFRETWDFIKRDNNSLKRYCNFHLFFE
ncbi:hypothetical protein [Tepidibacter hydrothermalis]|uniref:Uncharacterized protein n=1 Tax=Tepidibacter hydrothermalis TaxID=3036126 RepID=A0ABY8ED66_9FIRM|nr:hypothetical protein [Tepidibacter hydrothermalis]WFD10871.1 hypothetical protein P4S50_02000 [Tepidibacter hydrothermalis]